jgi:hypothetical protein
MKPLIVRIRRDQKAWTLHVQRPGELAVRAYMGPGTSRLAAFWNTCRYHLRNCVKRLDAEFTEAESREAAIDHQRRSERHELYLTGEQIELLLDGLEFLEKHARPELSDHESEIVAKLVNRFERLLGIVFVPHQTTIGTYVPGKDGN